MNLTDIGIRALDKPEKGATVYYDDTLKGFGVRVTANGVKSYVLTHGPRRTRKTIGRVGIIKLQDARTSAKQLLAEYTLGKTQPVSKRWKAALAEYLAEVKANRRKTTLKSYKRHLEGHFKFGDTLIEALSPNDFQTALDRLKGRRSEYHHAFVYLRIFIRWAFRKHYLDKNPLERMKPPPGSKKRKRVLTDAELVKVWNSCPDDPFGRIVRLLILCGQRMTETSNISHNMIGEDTITLPGEYTKNHRDHTFPFPKMARPYLHHLTYGGFSKAKKRLDEASGVYGWTLHDLRRTLKTNWAKLGVAKAVSEKYINHISGENSGEEETYNQYDYLPEMRAAVKRWEAYLQKLFKT